MKKTFLSAIALLMTVASFTFAAPKNGKIKGIKLNPKNKFAIEGVELGTLYSNESTVTNKGEILWNKEKDKDNCRTGWDVRGIDLSAYAGIRIELSTNPNQKIELQLRSPSSYDEWGFYFSPSGTVFASFNGVGKTWGTLKNPDLEEGFRIIIKVKGNYEKTVIKSVELIKKEDMPDISNLSILGVDFGSYAYNANAIGNEITWQKGTTSGEYGWDLSGVDLSEYDRVRIEIESSTISNLSFRIKDANQKNLHRFDNTVEPNVFELDLTGEGATSADDDATPLDKSKGAIIQLKAKNDNVPFDKDYKTVIKSVQLLKGKKEVNPLFTLNGKPFNCNSKNQNMADDGTIEWQWDGEEKYPYVGWNVKDIDLSSYKKIRVELEYTDIPLEIRLQQENGKYCDIGFEQISPTVIEARLDGSDFNWNWPTDTKWDSSVPIYKINIRARQVTKKGLKSKIKAITLLTEDNTVTQPDSLILNGARFGSKRGNAYLDESFAIDWQKANYNECGWRVEKLEGDILEIKVTSTDVPLRLRIRDINHENGKSYLDDGSHVFRINLKTKKQITGSKEIAPEWEEDYKKPIDFSNGGYICIETQDGTYKEGKKTVVEYIKVE